MAHYTRAAGLFGAAGVGALLHSYWGNAEPANLPSHPHHHHYSEAPAALKPGDLGHEAPRSTDNSALGLAETWVGPSTPANTTHSFRVNPGPSSTKDKLEIGVETTPSNSVFGLLHNWFGAPDTSRTKA